MLVNYLSKCKIQQPSSLRNSISASSWQSAVNSVTSSYFCYFLKYKCSTNPFKLKVKCTDQRECNNLLPIMYVKLNQQLKPYNSGLFLQQIVKLPVLTTLQVGNVLHKHSSFISSRTDKERKPEILSTKCVQFYGVRSSVAGLIVAFIPRHPLIIAQQCDQIGQFFQVLLYFFLNCLL